MKTYLYLTGTLFAVAALRHAVVTYGTWTMPNHDSGALLGEAAIGLVAAALAVWAFRLARRVTTPR